MVNVSEEKNMKIFENDQLMDSNLQPHPHRRSTTKLADFSATVDPASVKAPIFKPPADTKLDMEPRSEKNSVIHLYFYVRQVNLQTMCLKIILTIQSLMTNWRVYW